MSTLASSRRLHLLFIALGAALATSHASAQRAAEKLDEMKEAHARNLATLPVKRATELNSGGKEWCQTEANWRRKFGIHGSAARACATQGICDGPAVRDSWIPDGSTSIVTLRIKYNVFCNSDGSSCAATQTSANAQTAQLNSDFAPTRIQFEATTEFINNSTYRSFADSEETAMKNAYADSPATQLNVYVVNIQAGYLGVGTFPWDPDATGAQGGLIIDDNWFGAGQKTLTHEVGHCVGLWHTHHGVSEVVACSDCYERADGLNGDTTGDFASDTDPTPVNYNCSGPGGSDSCSGTSWGPTDPQNYMGYAPDSCYTEFSPQQWGRQHCWTEDELTGWIADTACDTNGDCDDGLYCNGAETCVGSVCQSGSDPCPGQSCDEGTDTCEAAPTMVLEWNMNTNPGWSTEGLWAWGQPAGGGGQYGGPDPTSGATGSNVIGYNLAGDYENNLPERHLTTAAIDCSNYEEVSVRFQRWLGVEVSTYDHAYFRVSNNGSTWTTLWQNTVQVADTSWSQQTFDISAYADGQPTVYLRWTIGTTDGSWQFCGWNIDDVQLWARTTGGGCTSDGDCDDGLFCNGAESCDVPSGNCQSGTAPNCNDGVACTDDSCNEATDSCNNVADNANCSNGLYCDGAETCHVTLGCQSGTPPNCNDGVGCTDDSCNESTDSCDNVPDDGSCDNGLYCDGVETCHVTLDCQIGSAVNCGDGVGCTDDTCNESTDSCESTPNDANCDNGLFCDGVETCHATLDCQSGSDPCPGQACNESTDTCQSGDCVVNGDCDDGNACTADVCNAGVCANDCAGAVSSYPFTENFEAGLGAWSNVGGDNFDWTRDANGTPSSGTGPSGDHTTGSGYYMFIETSSPRVAGDAAYFESPCIDLTATSSADLTFWYHMYGSSVGALNVQLSDDCTTWTNVWSRSGNQGNSWFQASVSLDAYAGSVVKVRFVGVRGSSWSGDIAIDDISVDASGAACSVDGDCADGDACTVDACVASVCQNTPISCDDGSDCTEDSCSGGVCTNVCAASVEVFPDTENFDAGFGDWANVSGDNFDWTRNSGGTPSSGTGPSGDHTSGSGWYMYIEASSPNYPSLAAILEGPCVDLGGATDVSMSFWYHMLGTAVGTLYVEVSEDCVSWAPVWSLSGNQGSAWQQANLDLSAYAGTTVTVRFRGVTGSSWSGDICVDDVVFDVAGEPECTVDGDCDDGLFCNGAESCDAGTCVAAATGGVANGTFDGSASWTSNIPSGGSISYGGNLNVVGPNAGSQAFTWSSQGGVVVNGADLEFDLLSYSSSDTGAWDYPVFYVNGTFYGLNTTGTLGAATTGGTSGSGTINNGSQVSSTIHFVVDIDGLAGSSGPHTIGLGVNSADGAYGAGTAVYDNVTPPLGSGDPCPGQTCDEVNDVCVP